MEQCTLILLLALACAGALQTPINKCMTVIHGLPEGLVTRLDDLKLESRTLNWKFSLNYGCVRGHHVGTLISACDFDAPPRVVMTNLRQATIHRRGNALTDGAVHTYVYCRTLKEDENVGGQRGKPVVISVDQTRSNMLHGLRKYLQ